MIEITLDDPPQRFDEPFDQYINDMQERMNVPSDWEYRPIPWMRNDFFDKLMDIIGDDNMRFLSSITRRIDGDMCTRASIFVSPQGIDNIRKYNETSSQS